ncbi:hypothetical protein Fcan01_17594 [Folsomia candida]|uniref:Uncharacterized protein n=1 Tax=Folsomia candida TaxID=158441 RepID=A0A226DR71_FOLCA|nr:hypothetical protein Fcan01_17594 [Folsomia candida]
MNKLYLLEGRVKRHLKHGNYFHCIYSKWDDDLGRIVKVTKTRQRSVFSFTILQLIVIALRVWSIISKSSSSTDRIIGTAVKCLTLSGFLFRCNPWPDYAQIEFLNYILSSRGERYGRKENLCLTCLILLMDALELGYYSIATFMSVVAMLLPCLPGLASYILCSSSKIFCSNNFLLRIVFAALEFLMFVQTSMGAAHYIVIFLLTALVFLWIECGTLISKEKVDKIEYRKATSSKERIIGTAVTSVTLAGFLFRCNPWPDYAQVEFLNYIFSSRGQRSGKKANLCLTFLILLMDALELKYYSIATIMFALTIALPCLSGLTSSIFCSPCNQIFNFLLRFAFAALEFFILLQTSMGAAHYIVIFLLTALVFLWIECGTLISKEKVDKIKYRKVTTMTKLSTLEGRVKRHLKHGNNFHCIYSKWDNNLGKIVRVTKTKRRSVLGFTILQLIVIAVRVWSIIFKSKSSTDRIIGTALTSVTLFGFIFRCDPWPDFIQMEFLNYIFCSRGERYGKKENLSLTCLILLLDALELSYYSVAALMAALTVILPCQPGLTSSILCSTNKISQCPQSFLRLAFTALEFLNLVQTGVE